MKIKKIQKISLIAFLFFMTSCAGLMIFIIWNNPDDFNILNRLAITSFIIGLASFLIWFITTIIEIKRGIEKKEFLS
jgi:hypothetical protein